MFLLLKAKSNQCVQYLIFYFLQIALITSRLYAQDVFTLEKAWEIARANNYALMQQEKLLAVKLEEISVQQSGFFPVLSMAASYKYQSSLPELDIPFQIPGLQNINISAGVKNQYDAGIYVNQPLFLGFRIENLQGTAKENYAAQFAQNEVFLNHLLLQIGKLYYEIQSNDLQQAVLEQSIIRVNNQLIRLRNLLKAGQSTPFDTLETANRKLQINTQLQKLKDINRILALKLLFILNRDNIPEIKSPEYLPETGNLETIDYYLDRARKNRPEIQQISALKQAQRLNTDILKSYFYPQVYANASYHYARPGVNFFKDEWMDYYLIGLNLKWELWNWNRDKRKVQQSKLMVDRLDIQQDELLSDINQQVKEAFQNLLTAETQIKMQDRLVDQEEERYKITYEKYSQGNVTSLDLRTVETALTEAQLVQQQNYILWRQYRLQLDFACGMIRKNH